MHVDLHLVFSSSVVYLGDTLALHVRASRSLILCDGCRMYALFIHLAPFGWRV